MNKIRTETIPEELRLIPQWVVWIWASRDGKATKIPIDPKTRRSAAVNDPDTWGTFDDAHSLATRWNTPGGIGFMFTADDPYCGVDVDACRDPKTGEFTAGAIDVIRRMATYTEVSPSGTGAKMICRAVLPDGRNRTEGIEFYDRGRFFTVTGNYVPGTPANVEHRQEAVAVLHSEFFPPKEQPLRKRPAESSGPADRPTLDDDELCRRISRSKGQGPKFDALMAGDIDGYESRSEADCALSAILAWWTGGDRDQMLRIVRTSALWRDKWERPDYVTRTFDAGLAGVTDFYGSKREREKDRPAPLNAARPTQDAVAADPGRMFLWASELLAPEQSNKWIWEGYLSRGGITLMSALWKIGKTTLLSHLLRAFETDGEFCGLEVKGSRVLYITEEDAGTWAERRDYIKIRDHVGFVCRPFLGRPNAAQWADLIAKVVSEVEAHKFDLVIFDTLAKLWPVKEENSSSQVDEALIPLWAIPSAGAAVLLVHHVRKGDGQEATGSRGSGALTAFVETIVELRRFDPQDKKNTRRVLTGYGRYRETPDELVIDLTPAGYVAEGDREESQTLGIMEVAFDLLPGAAPGMTAESVIAEWEAQDKPGQPPKKSATLKALHALFDGGRINREGRGKKGSPFTFWKG